MDNRMLYTDPVTGWDLSQDRDELIADLVKCKSLVNYAELNDDRLYAILMAPCIDDISSVHVDYAVREIDWLVDNLPVCLLTQDAREYRDNVLLA